MAEQAKGFWSSIPGILTGIAAIITATTGLYIAINGNGPATGEDPATQPTPQSIVEPKDPILEDPLPREPGSASPLTTKDIDSIEATAQKAYEELAQTSLKPLVDCELFPTVNSTASLMSWSKHYQQQILSDNDKAHACNKTIDYRGMAHCKEPNNLEVRQALYETLTLCRAAGIEWTDIEHSPLQK